MTNFDDIATQEARKTQGHVLIDKLHIKNLDTTVVDENKLRSKATFVKKQNGQIGYKITGDAFFGRFDFNLMNRETIFSKTYGDKLQSHVVGKRFGNLICDNIEELNTRLTMVKDRLYSEYGVEINYDMAIISYIEINKTIHLQHGSFADYRRVLLLLLSLVPQRFNLDGVQLNGTQVYIDDITSYTEIQSLYRKNADKTLAFILYDKKKELSDNYGIAVADDFLRFEVSLRGRKVDGLHIEGNQLSMLSDEAIENFMRNTVKNYFKDTFDKWLETRLEEVSEIFKNEYEKDCRHFLVNTLNILTNREDKGTPYILSYQELRIALSYAGLNTLHRERDLREYCRDTYLRFNGRELEKARDVIDKLYDIFDTKSI